MNLSCRRSLERQWRHLVIVNVSSVIVWCTPGKSGRKSKNVRKSKKKLFESLHSFCRFVFGSHKILNPSSFEYENEFGDDNRKKMAFDMQFRYTLFCYGTTSYTRFTLFANCTTFRLLEFILVITNKCLNSWKFNAHHLLNPSLIQLLLKYNTIYIYIYIYIYITHSFYYHRKWYYYFILLYIYNIYIYIYIYLHEYRSYIARCMRCVYLLCEASQQIAMVLF